MIWGDTDRVAPVEPWTKAFSEEITNGQITLRVLHRCGHLPMLEYPALFADLLMEVLGKHNG